MNETEGKKVKTREIKHDIKVMDKAAAAAKNMKKAAARTKDHAQNLMDDGRITPEEYAGDTIRHSAEEAALNTGETVKRAARKTGNMVGNQIRRRQERKQAEEFKERLRQHREHSGDLSTDYILERALDGNTDSAPNPGQQEVKQEQEQPRQNRRECGVRQHEAKTRTSLQTKKSRESHDARRQTIKQRVKITNAAHEKNKRATVKTTRRNIKTAEQTSRTVIKTAKEAEIVAKKAARAAAKRARRAAAIKRQTTAAAYRIAKAVARAVTAAVKGCIAAVRKLIAAIAAGGWVAVAVIMIVCIVGLIVASVFGIFLSSEDTGSGITMQQVVRDINDEYQSRLEDEKAAYAYDDVEMSGSSAVWREVLSIYSVRVTNDPDNPQEVATIDDEKIEMLRSIFWDMNVISSRTETRTVTVIVESDDGEGNIVEEEVEETRTVLCITVTHSTAYEMAEQYGFTDYQKEQLAELLNEDNRQMWAAVLYGIHVGRDNEIVAVALSQIGNVGGEPYWSWYGFDSRVDWCACFVSWCANECGYIENGIIPKFAGCSHGVQWFKDRNQWIDGNEEPMPGMIIFFDWDNTNGQGPQDGAPDHTGIVVNVENGIIFTVEGNAGDQCKEKQYIVGNTVILGFGVPAY